VWTVWGEIFGGWRVVNILTDWAIACATRRWCNYSCIGGGTMRTSSTNSIGVSGPWYPYLCTCECIFAEAAAVSWVWRSLSVSCCNYLEEIFEIKMNITSAGIEEYKNIIFLFFLFKSYLVSRHAFANKITRVSCKSLHLTSNFRLGCTRSLCLVFE
jgi:hypothetical protein